MPCLCQRGGNRASVLSVFQKSHKRTRVALVHTHMPRHVLGWVGWGGDVNVRCTCTHAHATSRLGLGGVGWGC